MKKKVLIFGGTGMLGHSLFNQYAARNDLDIYATVMETSGLEKWFAPESIQKLLMGVNVDNFDAVVNAFETIKPDVVINCIALVRQSQIINNVLSAIKINAELPHKLALICQDIGARFIHISSDIVFDGKKGMYAEHDNVNISDLYGMTKFLGEVGYSNCVTIRTSIIGHELIGKSGLVEWFLSQNVKMRGYTKAIYSGFPTIELARIISDYILPNDNLSGLYHISSDPISKYDLLKLIADRYGKQIEIEPYDEFALDRSLDSSLFRSLTGYNPPSWTELINKMYIDHNKYKT
ncbi:MAG: SDR family oxidoreductase [bacterium]